ncbi:MAG: hypothetical protein DHS20C05_08170 [Hyphococcus sp.]|nr:MAG: hypothetical protein DHS20C05_08170 [Marinicaulis sp.]
MLKPTPHQPEGLMAKLAKAMQVDLSWLQQIGRISPRAVNRMQNHCRACPKPDVCNRKIELSEGNMHEPPEFCPNKNIFQALKRESKK